MRLRAGALRLLSGEGLPWLHAALILELGASIPLPLLSRAWLATQTPGCCTLPCFHNEPPEPGQKQLHVWLGVAPAVPSASWVMAGTL